MATKIAAEPEVPTAEPPTPEVTPETVETPAQVEVTAQEPEAPAPEKPDIKSLWAELPLEERRALAAEEDWHKEALKKAEDDAYSKLVQRQQREAERQAQANHDLQSTLQNLDTASDDNTRAQAIHGYAVNVASRERQAQAEEDGTYFGGIVQKVFGLNPAQFDVKWLDAQRTAAAEGRRADWGDLLHQIVGEKYVPKGQVSKDMRAEFEALWAEKQGQNITNQPAPVVLGPGAGPASDEQHDRVMTSGSIEERRAEFKRAHGFDPPF